MHHRDPHPALRLAVVLAIPLLLLAAVACGGAPEADGGATPADTADAGTAADGAGPATSTAPADDDYAERMSEEHAGDAPVPGFAREAGLAGNLEVVTERVQYATVGGDTVTGYLALPEGAGRRPDAGVPALLVIHEWWGLNDNVETMARLFARHGYAALAVDLYGGRVAETPEGARELMGGLDEAAAEDNLRQALGYLVREHGAERIGVVGWCFGGGWSLRTALLMPEQVDAAVVYYGRLVQDRDRLATLDMPILGIFGAEDQGIPVADVRRFEATLEDLGKDATIRVYEGAGHAFANPSGQRYEPEAAKDAWETTLAFLDRHLEASP